MPPHARLRACIQAWVQLDDSYVVKVIREGLRLPWRADFNPEDPQVWNRPQWARNPPDLPDVVQTLVNDLLKTGSVREVPRSDLQSCSSIFAIPKANSNKWQMITNLRNLNVFLVTETFKLP